MTDFNLVGDNGLLSGLAITYQKFFTFGLDNPLKLNMIVFCVAHCLGVICRCLNKSRPSDP
jgi:hypothetical protein